MSDVLSQAEIDALLSALTSGEVSADEIREEESSNRIRTYDFRRAMRFSKDHIRIIERIHEHFGRLLTTNLSGQLRSVVQFTVESVDQVPYEEFIRSVPISTVAQIVELAPLPGRIVVDFDPQVVFAMIDRLMGGLVKGPYRDRELTEIEQTLFGRMLTILPDALAEAWKNVVALTPRLLNLESNPQFIQLTTPNETVLVVSLSARIGAASGFVSLCIPHVTVEPVMNKLVAQRLMSDGRAIGPDKEIHTSRVTSFLSGAEVGVSVVLGSTELSLEELLGLQEGDMIPLDTPIGSAAMVCVNGVPTYEGAIGQAHRKYAVQICGDWKEVADSEPERQVISRGN